jgi:hypothetical protein
MTVAAPPGWDENPTAWPKRLRIAALAFAGLCVSTYLTLYQLRFVAGVWEPFFGDGSRAVLGWTHPFPDAALGVLAYSVIAGGLLVALAMVPRRGQHRLGRGWRAVVPLVHAARARGRLR